MPARFEIPVGDHNGIVDVGAHLDGADDEIGQEKQILVLQIRRGEVDQDTALDHDDQQQRQTHGMEGEDQNQRDEHDLQDRDNGVVVFKRALEIAAARRIADHKVFVVIARRDPAQGA